MDEPRHVGAPPPAEPKIPREAETPTPSPGEDASCATPPSPCEEAAAPPQAAALTKADPTGVTEKQGATAAAEAPVSPGADSIAEFAAVSSAEVEPKGDHETEAPPAAIGEGGSAGPTSEPEAATEPEPQLAATPHPAEPEPQTAQAVAVAEAEPQAGEAVAAVEAQPEPAEAVAVAEAAPEAAEPAAAVEPDLRMLEVPDITEPEPRPTETGGAQVLGAGPPSLSAGPAHAPAAPRATGPAALSWGHRSEASAAPAMRTQGPSARPVPAWLPPSLPSREAVGRYLRLAGHVAAAVVVGFVGIVLALVVLYRWVDPPASTLMLGQRLAGTPIERRWVPLERISPHLVKAVILSEDGGFCRHRGVDWTALGQAMEDARGGSTITMQVVKNLFLWPSRSYVRKAIEIALAGLVELIWPKRRILEIYLNIAEWGDGVFGAEAAARWHFGKSAARLTAAEAALLAVALPNPTERTAGSPGPGMRRLASRLMVRMAASRVSLSCVRTAPRLPREAHLFPGRD